MLERVKEQAAKQGCTVVGFCEYANPADNYLAVVLCRREDASLVSWVYNDNDRAFIWGRYHDEARPAFAERIQNYCVK